MFGEEGAVGVRGESARLSATLRAAFRALGVVATAFTAFVITKPVGLVGGGGGVVAGRRSRVAALQRGAMILRRGRGMGEGDEVMGDGEMRSRDARSVDVDGWMGRSTLTAGALSRFGSRSKSWHPRTRRSVDREGGGGESREARRRRGDVARRGAGRRTSSQWSDEQSTLRVFPVPVGLSKIPMPPRSSTSYRPRMRSSWMS